MNHLFRSLAPITDEGWAEIDGEARRTLTHHLAARKLVDFVGPKGWAHSAVSLGRVESEAEVRPGVETRRRRVQPLLELRATFALSRDEVDAVDRGAGDPDLAPLVEACRNVAMAEDTLVFEGDPACGIEGMATASPHDPIPLTDDFDRYANHVAKAVAELKAAGVGGPYAIALGPKCYRGVIESTEKGGYPLLNHLHLILGGPVVWAPAVDGALVLSQRGGDFELTVGEDLSVGYRAHDADTVTLFLEESLTFRALTPEAAIALRY